MRKKIIVILIKNKNGTQLNMVLSDKLKIKCHNHVVLPFLHGTIVLRLIDFKRP